MVEYSKLVTTEKGRALMIKMLTGVEKIKFTKICASNEKYSESQLENLTSLDDVRQTGVVSKMTQVDDTTIKVETAFTNTNLLEGYYMRTLGLYAEDPDEGEILYAACIASDDNCYMPPDNGTTSTGVYINMYQTVGNADNVLLDVDSGVFATIGNIQELTQWLNSHTDDTDNPHNVTKQQLGLGDVDNTSDLNKPISIAVQEALDTYYAQLTAYTNKAIAELIDGAPTTLDTLKELADAINDNKSIQEALDAAIGEKANQNEFDSHITAVASSTVAGHVKVDNVLSSTSTNPVQNNVVNTALFKQQTKCTSQTVTVPTEYNGNTCSEVVTVPDGVKNSNYILVIASCGVPASAGVNQAYPALFTLLCNGAGNSSPFSGTTQAVTAVNLISPTTTSITVSTRIIATSSTQDPSFGKQMSEVSVNVKFIGL